jgi:hypothetical protein
MENGEQCRKGLLCWWWRAWPDSDRLNPGAAAGKLNMKPHVVLACPRAFNECTLIMRMHMRYLSSGSHSELALHASVRRAGRIRVCGAHHPPPVEEKAAVPTAEAPSSVPIPARMERPATVCIAETPSSAFPAQRTSCYRGHASWQSCGRNCRPSAVKCPDPNSS